MPLKIIQNSKYGEILVGKIFAKFIVGNVEEYEKIIKNANNFKSSTNFLNFDTLYFHGINIVNDEICENDIMALILVGFWNIHSILTSLLYRYTKYDAKTEWKQQLKITTDFRLDFNTENIINQFFFETYRMAPPVWIQGRRVGSEPIIIKFDTNGNDRCYWK